MYHQIMISVTNNHKEILRFCSIRGQFFGTDLFFSPESCIWEDVQFAEAPWVEIMTNTAQDFIITDGWPGPIGYPHCVHGQMCPYGARILALIAPGILPIQVSLTGCEECYPSELYEDELRICGECRVHPMNCTRHKLPNGQLSMKIYAGVGDGHGSAGP